MFKHSLAVYGLEALAFHAGAGRIQLIAYPYQVGFDVILWALERRGANLEDALFHGLADEPM